MLDFGDDMFNDEQLKQWRKEYAQALAEVDRLKAEAEQDKEDEYYFYYQVEAQQP